MKKVFLNLLVLVSFLTPAFASERPEVYVQLGHTSVVPSVAFSPDGRYALSESWDGTGRIWDINTGEEIAQLVGFTDGEWVTVTPECYFNASPNGARHLNV